MSYIIRTNYDSKKTTQNIINRIQTIGWQRKSLRIYNPTVDSINYRKQQLLKGVCFEYVYLFKQNEHGKTMGNSSQVSKQILSHQEET